MAIIETGSLIFMDIETASGKANFEELSEDWQALWNKKAGKTITDDATLESHYHDKAALFAEFGRVVCISFGYYRASGSERKLRIKSIAKEDEKALLQEFCDDLKQFEKHHRGWAFAGHNIREFDIPYLSRRILINGLELPESMRFYDKKPWDILLVDTMQFWRFGDFKSYISLELLAAALGIPSPKDDIDGSMVGEIFWKDKDLKRIAVYCQKDVLTVANIIRKLNGKPLLQSEEVEYV
ncbi:MAG: ribonuclease H-like domain-containing protein [Chitinophagaceae bacterium]|nr:ribonuclease H-like domain-containing protein [Chitinophagaceae bacterium]